MIELSVPPSKSLTQRGIFIGSLTNGITQIIDYLKCDDSLYLIDSLKRLNVTIEEKENNILYIYSNGRFKKPTLTPLYVGNAGTAARFLTALSIIVDFEFSLDGDESIYYRPFPGLFATLSKLGIGFKFYKKRFSLPVTLYPSATKGKTVPKVIEIDSQASSQQLSALLMVLPTLNAETVVKVKGALPSQPYVDLTLYVMEKFGVKVINNGYKEFYIPNTNYTPTSIKIEGDWSSASFIIALSFLIGREIKISNIDPLSLQGDRLFPELVKLLPKKGEYIEVDMSKVPDLVPPFTALALSSNGITVMKNIAHLRLKECDRISVLVKELSKAGFNLKEEKDKLIVYGGRVVIPSSLVYLDPHKDHRMAMTFGILSMKYPWIRVTDKECVTKSFPNFWEILDRIKTYL